MATKETTMGVETIAVKIGGKIKGTYRGLAGTFAGFADSCLRRKELPGFCLEDLILEAERQDRNLLLRLKGKRTPKKIMEIMDISLANMVAFPGAPGEAECFIEVESEK